jgi:hypothetical protein
MNHREKIDALKKYYSLRMLLYPFLQVVQLCTADQQSIKYHLSWQQLANREYAPESDVHLKNYTFT